MFNCSTGHFLMTQCLAAYSSQFLCNFYKDFVQGIQLFRAWPKTLFSFFSPEKQIFYSILYKYVSTLSTFDWKIIWLRFRFDHVSKVFQTKIIAHISEEHGLSQASVFPCTFKMRLQPRINQRRPSKLAIVGLIQYNIKLVKRSSISSNSTW